MDGRLPEYLRFVPILNSPGGDSPCIFGNVYYIAIHSSLPHPSHVR